MTTNCESDLLIIGGGPAGLSAAINAASEGLKVRMLDNGSPLGGQARESAAIENYPGFPDGATGSDLMSTFVRQARKFGTHMVCPVNAAKLEKDEKVNRFIITTDDYQEYRAKAVLLSLGLSYRRLMAEGLAPLMGRGVFYGRPAGTLQRNCKVAVIGGANSAGQAVEKLASNPHVHVRMIIRKGIQDQMSMYLIERIKQMPNVTVMESCEVVAVYGDRRLQSMDVKCADGVVKRFDVDQMNIFIGATPRTFWLRGSVQVDKSNFILTDEDLTWNDSEYQPMRYETSIRGLFAAGDVRAGSIKRIASAIGEGAAAVPMIHRYLAALTEASDAVAAQ